MLLSEILTELLCEFLLYAFIIAHILVGTDPYWTEYQNYMSQNIALCPEIMSDNRKD